MVVIAASGIERRAAVRAQVSAIKILPDGEFVRTHTAQHGGGIPFLTRPDFNRMAG